jgi:phosphomannomutase
MTAYVFDVDGVLCDRNEYIDTEFKEWFNDWANGKTIYFITGSERHRTIEQIGIEIVNKAKISFHCLGNSIWISNREFLINQIELFDIEYNFLLDILNNSKFEVKTGNHIEIRKGSVNFSIVGRNADREQRKIYSNYDKLYNERLSIVQKIKDTFPRLDAFLGGDVSIDICLRGADKSQCRRLIEERELYFFGDRCYKNGIDEPFAKMCQGGVMQAFQINNGYNETWNILKTL